MSAADDEKFMAAAIAVSQKHLGQTGTNPSVGCVIVKDGVILAEAVTAIGGRPHAEPQALALAGEAASGATAYVTLEPCSHYGHTPPCANALIASGVARVVVSVTDPDARVSGRGLSMLREAGIEVESGILEKEGRRSLAGYLMRQTKGRPYVTLKLAVSADGMIGRRGAGQVAITGPLARAEVQQLRAESDAILVGIGTAIADDPELTVRLPGMEDRSPLRIVLDRELCLPLTSKLVKTAITVPVMIFTTPVGIGRSSEYEDRRAALSAAGVEIVEGGSLAELLVFLGKRGISSLMVEGGAAAADAFLTAGLIDCIQLYEGQGEIGSEGIASPVTRAHIGKSFRLVGEHHFGPDRRFDYERID